MDTLIFLVIVAICFIIVVNKYPVIAVIILIIAALMFIKLPPVKPSAVAPPAQTFNWSDLWNKLPTISQLQLPSLNWQGIMPGQILGWKMSMDGEPIAVTAECPVQGTGLIMSGTAGYDRYSIPSTVCVQQCVFQFPQGTAYSTTWDENGKTLYFHIGTAYSNGARCNAT